MTITFILFTVLFWQSALRLSMVTWFWAHNEFVKTELCEQREVEDNCCKGKCYLTKEVKKTEAPRTQEATIIEFSELIFILPMSAHTPDVEADASPTALYLELSTSSFPRTIFHPPAVMVA